MRYLAILALVVGIWYFVGRSKTDSSSSFTAVASTVSATPAAASPAHTNAFKAPIDRAQGVVNTVNRKTAEGF